LEDKGCPVCFDTLIYPNLCACCCKVPGTEETVIYSTGKVNEIRGCGCGNAVLSQYATARVRICGNCRKKIDLNISKRRIRNICIALCVSLVAGVVYYLFAGNDVYVSVIVGFLPLLAGYKWILLNERMINGLFIGKLIRSGKNPNEYTPVFVNQEFQDRIGK